MNDDGDKSIRTSHLSNELHKVLSVLYEAGGEGVPASELRWTKDMVPTLNRALEMQYIRRRETRSEVVFSLTRAGYETIGARKPAYMSLWATLALLFKSPGRK